jgi:ABC-type branched-subunit amino acid transport system substrate-binding protein
MKLTRRNFIRTASSALAFVSSTAALTRAGLAQAEPIRIANILDATGGLNSYSLKQIKSTAMAVEELNQSGGLLGRPIELVFYDSQSNNQLNSQYATQALVKDKVHVVMGGITSSSCGLSCKSSRASTSTTRSTRAASVTVVMSALAWFPASRLPRWLNTSSRKKA